MDKTTLEQILVDCERASKFCEQAIACNPCLRTAAPQPSSSRVRRAEPVPHGTYPTDEDVQRNFRQIQHQYLLGDFRALLPSLSQKDPNETLALLTARYKEFPSARNASLIESSINRLILAGELSEDSRKLVSDALEVLGEKRSALGNAESGSIGDDIRCWVYEHADFKGRVAFFDEYSIYPGVVYKSIPELRSISLNDAISSITVEASGDEVGGHVVLFEDDRYFGRYSRFDATPGAVVKIPYVGNFINDITSSILMIRRFRNELTATPLGDLVSRDDIKNLVKSHKGIWPRGEPVLTWDLWPEGHDHHPNSPHKAYVYVKIPIGVEPDPDWFDYDAEIRYWVYFYVDTTGKLQGYVDYYGAWVEGGLITDRVLSGLMDQIPSTIDDVNSQIAKALNVANLAGPFEMVYLLPGRFAQQGSTDDDVTLVLVQGTPTVPDGPIF